MRSSSLGADQFTPKLCWGVENCAVQRQCWGLAVGVCLGSSGALDFKNWSEKWNYRNYRSYRNSLWEAGRRKEKLMQFCPVLPSLVCICDSEILGCGIKKKQQNPTCCNCNCSNPVLVLWCCPCISAWREGDVSKSSVTMVFVARAAQAWENIRLFIKPFS